MRGVAMTAVWFCYLLALVCFVLAAAGAWPRVNWQSAGFAFLVLSLLA